MQVIRPVRAADLDQLYGLTHAAGVGLTTLPTDREFLRRRVRRSERGFAGVADPCREAADAPGGESYLLVIEEAGRVVGTAGVVGKVGGFEPFYAFRIETTVHASAALRVRKEVRVLHLVAEHSGPCEVGSLFLAKEARGGDAGRLLSLSRFLFMADHPQCFDPTVLAEVRGVVDDATGHSPFWDALGRHFFDVDYPTADYLSVVDKRFIAELMPKHPIYVTLLPPDAQAVIGQPHPASAPALRLLEGEGFARAGMVDIFDAGPIVTCPLGGVRVVRESRRAAVAAVVPDASLAGPACLVTNARADFRACAAPVEATPDGDVRLGDSAAGALGVTVGETVRYSPLRGAKAGPRGAAVEPDGDNVIDGL